MKTRKRVLLWLSVLVGFLFGLWSFVDRNVTPQSGKYYFFAFVLIVGFAVISLLRDATKDFTKRKERL